MTKLIGTVIVDDEPLAREGIRMLLERDSEIGAISEAKDGRQAVKIILAKAPDLVFLDVQMPEMGGFEVLRKVGVEILPAVIFVTAYEKYAVEAFEIQAVDYLLKPFTVQRFRQALDRAKTRLRGGERSLDGKALALLEQMAKGPGYLERVAVKSSRGTVFVSVADVGWIDAAENYVRLHTGGGDHLIQTTMNGITQKLNPANFLRIHRSLIVNINHIQDIHPGFHGEYILRLKSGVQLRSGRTYHESMKQLLSNTF